MLKQPTTEARAAFDSAVDRLRRAGLIGENEIVDPLEVMAALMVSAKDHRIRKRAATELMKYVAAKALLEYCVAEPCRSPHRGDS